MVASDTVADEYLTSPAAGPGPVSASNVWGTPEVMVHKQSVLDAHCRDVGRDPSEIQRSACALLMMTEDRDLLGRARASGRAVLGGSNDEIRQAVQAYVDAGVDEMIIPDFALGSNARQRIEQMDRFVEEIVPEFRRPGSLDAP